MSDGKNDHPYVRLARAAVERHLRGEPPICCGAEIDPDEKLWRPRRACFVSIKTLAGDLRGCIGTITPFHPALDLEIIANAVSSATHDPRFSSMTAGELGNVVFSVDVLGVPEAVSDISELDPVKWGVIVSQGMRRGVLLPDLEGVRTAEYQISIAMQKGGISRPDGMKIERFSVDRYREGE